MPPEKEFAHEWLRKAHKDVCEQLSSFAVDVRYPGGIVEPPRLEAEAFYDQARRIYDKVETLIKE